MWAFAVAGILILFIIDEEERSLTCSLYHLNIFVGTYLSKFCKITSKSDAEHIVIWLWQNLNGLEISISLNLTKIKNVLNITETDNYSKGKETK